VKTITELLRKIAPQQWLTNVLSLPISIKDAMLNDFIDANNFSYQNFPNLSLGHTSQVGDFQHVFTKSSHSKVNLDRSLNYPEIWVDETALAPKPLHIMMLGLRGFPNVQGGVETHAEHLAPLLANLGCTVEVIVRSPYQDKSIGSKWCGVSFTRIWAPKSKGLEAIIHTFLGVLYAAIKRPDVLHIHAIGPALMTPLARMLGLKVVITHHGPDYDRQKWGGFAKNTLMLGEWMGMRFSNGRIVISNVIRDLVMHKHKVASSLIFNGVVMPNTDISDDHLEQFKLQKNKYILLVSRLVPEKRHHDLIDAFNLANLAGYKLVFVGAADHQDAYAQSVLQAVKGNPNIVMTGFQTGDHLRALYTHAATFVLPSSHEGLSISLLEALSFGLPVVASNIPANLALELDPKCYFELGNVEALASLLKRNINEPVSIESKIQIRNWVESQYNWRNIANKTFNEYRRISS
jgi:glycosyltransferase involved in cell wall biosynthesis